MTGYRKSTTGGQTQPTSGSYPTAPLCSYSWLRPGAGSYNNYYFDNNISGSETIELENGEATIYRFSFCKPIYENWLKITSTLGGYSGKWFISTKDGLEFASHIPVYNSESASYTYSPYSTLFGWGLMYRITGVTVTTNDLVTIEELMRSRWTDLDTTGELRPVTSGTECRKLINVYTGSLSKAEVSNSESIVFAETGGNPLPKVALIMDRLLTNSGGSMIIDGESYGYTIRRSDYAGMQFSTDMYYSSGQVMSCTSRAFYPTNMVTSLTVDVPDLYGGDLEVYFDLGGFTIGTQGYLTIEQMGNSIGSEPTFRKYDSTTYTLSCLSPMTMYRG